MRKNLVGKTHKMALGMALLFLSTAILLPRANAQVFYVSTTGPEPGQVKQVGLDGTPGPVLANYPSAGGIAVNGAGNIFVYDGVDSVYELTPQGGSTLFASGLPYLEGLAFDANGILYGASTSTHDQVGIINSSGYTELNLVGEPVYSASGLLFTGDGNLLVTNTSQYGANPNSLVLLTRPTEPEGEWGAQVLFNFEVNSQPTGLAFDDNGNLYITLINSGDIIKLFPDFTQDTSFDPQGLIRPSDVVFVDGSLYVSQGSSYAIAKVELDGSWGSFVSMQSTSAFIAYSPVPEPSAVLLVLGGAAILGVRRRRAQG